ncbi:MAG: hypothetical protein L0H10_16360 [Comamonas sp.]|uniref:hypothetical protein n=1 Tax=Comamonas sp. TaxID=34028 RepID=UPI002647762E|nr:hypothetical protein [Comamonas sp.]MDN5505367.1 hypothetical protein [Comamonas sp.]MDN5537192.1 hypothetical protein [Comamonas sp.]
MGLDVTAYKKLSKLDALFDSDGDPVNPITREPFENYFRAKANNDFPGRDEGLEAGAIYSYEARMGGWSSGYGRYNSWRNELAKLAGYPLGSYKQYGKDWPSYCSECWNGRQGPFSELINFTDCDGVIGPVVAAKLAKDFAEFDSKAQAIDSDFYEKYAEWREVFEFAADNGAVDFH